MKTCIATALLLVFLAFSSSASLIASDNGGNYASWGTDGQNGGAGFGAWTFRTFVGIQGGFAGFYTDTGTPGVTNWAMYANQANLGGSPQSVAFRDFTGGSLGVGQTFNIQFYNVGVDYAGGSVGLTLRTGNITNGVSDYNNGSRFEFSFLQGAANYYIYDNSGTFDTSIPWQNTGLNLSLTLTSADTYDFKVVQLGSSTTNLFTGRTLGGTSGNGLDSVALYNRFAGPDADQGNIRWNDMSVIPEPSTIALLAMSLAGLLIGRRFRG
jgi:hypothetical protein